jgi:hypothetical protein
MCWTVSLCRCEVEDVTWERPTTSERQRGSVPMTVLHPRPEYAAAAGSSSSSSDAHAPGSLIWDQQQQQRGTGDRSSVPGKGGAWEQGGGATSSSKAATSPGQTPQVPLKVGDKAYCWTGDAPGLSPCQHAPAAPWLPHLAEVCSCGRRCGALQHL